MPLNKFVPLSPDPYITSDPEMTLAKFGHLNTIVDYLNGTNALTNIKIAGINNTAGYIDFSANPTGSTTVVGAIRTYQDGTNLSEVLQFREDGTIFGSGSQTASNFVIQSDDDLTNLYLYSSACWGGLLTNTPLGNYNTILNGRIIGTHGGTGNSALALGTIQADTSGSNFSIAMGAGCTITNTQNGLAIGRNASITSAGESTAIGYQATTSTVNAIALGNSNALLQIGGNFVPTARVHVKGLGATSATTSLLVQNSSTFQLLKVTDDGQCQIGANGLTTFPLQVYGNSGLQIQVGNTFFSYEAVRTIRFLNSNNGIPLNHEVVNQVSSTDNSNYVYFRNQTIQTAGSLAPFIGISIETPVNTQTSAIVTQLNIAPIFNLQANTTSGSIQRGIYYNPTITDLRTAKHYGIQTTSGGAYINTATPNASAALQADSTTQGFLPPRMTTAQKNLIATPATGLQVHDTDLNRPCFYNGTSWVTL